MFTCCDFNTEHLDLEIKEPNFSFKDPKLDQETRYHDETSLFPSVLVSEIETVLCPSGFEAACSLIGKTNAVFLCST